MRVLDLFSGIGGFSLGLESVGMETVAFCEMDSFCQKVLKKHWPNVPIHSDIKELDGDEYRGTVELICGGFPCQPFSVAGEQRGAEDDRALWPEMLRVICEVQPTWVIGENVSGIINMELDNVLSNLEAEGYAAQTFVLPACSVDAKHRRDRVWIVAHSNGQGEPNESEYAGAGQRVLGNAEHDGSFAAEISRGDGKTFESPKTKGTKKTRESQRASGPEHHQNVANSSGQSRRGRRVHRESGDQGWGAGEARGESISAWSQMADSHYPTESSENVADSINERSQGGIYRREGQGREDKLGHTGCSSSTYGQPRKKIWLPEPSVGRVANGVPDRTHRLKGLGNAVVPPLVAEIGRIVMYHQENGLDPR
jgi:DNA (cytosine-5)-methyltransferase 1